MKRLLWILLAGAAALSAGVYLFFCAEADPERMLPNTTVNGVNVGGMTLAEAEEILEEDAEARREAAVCKVSYCGKEYEVALGDALNLDWESAAKKALQQSQYGFLRRGYSYLKSFFQGNHCEYLATAKDTGLLLEKIADSGLLEASAGDEDELYRIEEDRLILSVPADREIVNTDRLMAMLISAVQAEDYASVIICPVTVEKAEEVDLEQIYQEIHREPQDAALDPADGYAIVPSVTGVDFDRENAQEQLDAAEPGGTVAISLSYTEPEITTQDLESRLFADVLASYTTTVTGSSNRRTNVSLAVEKCGSFILQKGDVFSFNDTVGEQTAETGFQLAGATLNGEVVQAYGGGICQVSSTIFAAALLANLEIVERWCHEYVSTYIPAGMDAAVAWGALDFRIASNQAYPVKVEVSESGSQLSVRILGTKTDGSSVEVETETLDSPDDSLDVKTCRKVSNEDGSQVFVEDVAYSSYIRGKKIS